MQATGLAISPARLRATPEVPPPSRSRISEGSVVSMHYTLQLEDATVVESSNGKPFQYLHGAGNVVPGLERELKNRAIGDRLSVEVSPEHGYGVENPSLIKRIPRSDFPADAQLTPGMRFGSQLDDGTVLPAWVTDIDGDELTVNYNHPLAGKTLYFVVEVVGIRDARPDELRCGLPTGPSGFQRR